MMTRNMWKIFFLSGCSLLFGVSCKENDGILSYNTGDKYIYFAVENTAYNPTERFLDSLSYSFAFDVDNKEDKKKLAIPVRLTGLPADADHDYTYRIDPDSSDYEPALVKFSDPVFGKDRVSDTLFLTVSRSAVLKSKTMSIYLELEANEFFKVGNAYNKALRIQFSDVLTRPAWWDRWERIFGPYHREVFQLWMSIYAKGIDPTPNIYDSNETYYYNWENMPDAVQSWFPATFMYVNVLRDYLLKNPVYPDGDSTKERIVLP